MFDKIKPLHDRVLVERIEEKEDKTKGGIIIPDSAKEETTQIGKIIAVGKGKMTQEGKIIPMDVKIGDVVFFGKYSGTKADDNYLIISEGELLGVVEEQ